MKNEFNKYGTRISDKEYADKIWELQQRALREGLPSADFVKESTDLLIDHILGKQVSGETRKAMRAALERADYKLKNDKRLEAGEKYYECLTNEEITKIRLEEYVTVLDEEDTLQFCNDELCRSMVQSIFQKKPKL
jgi:hypothetical protein